MTWTTGLLEGTAMAYSRRLLTDDEEVIREFHPHWRVLLMAGMWTVVGLAVIVVGWLVLDLTGVALWAVVAVGALVILALAVPTIVQWKFRLYVLTTERIVVRSGVVSRDGTEIPLESINNVLYSQSVMERLLGYGDVLIESAGSQGQSRLDDIPDPEAFQSEVYRAREERSLHFQQGPASAPRDAVAQLESLAALHQQGVLTDEEFQEKKAKLLDQI